jgi:hypothetical protein
MVLVKAILECILVMIYNNVLSMHAKVPKRRSQGGGGGGGAPRREAPSLASKGDRRSSRV